MDELKNWNEVKTGLYRYVVGANVAYEIHISYFEYDTDILSTTSSLHLVGEWREEGKTFLGRKCLLDEGTVKQCLEKAVEDYKENMS